MKTILVAVDGSGHSERAVHLASDLARKYDAKLLLLHVIANRDLTDAERQLARSEYAGQIEGDAATSSVMELRALGSQGIEPIFAHHSETARIIHTALGEGLLEADCLKAKDLGAGDVEAILETGDPAETILAVAKRRKADLIVVGSRGRGDLKALFLGSVSHKVANLAEANVVTVK